VAVAEGAGSSRDPGCVLHNVVVDRNNEEGDFKLYGRAQDVQDPKRRKRYRETIEARIDWAPDEPNFHCFAIDVDSAGFVIFGDKHDGMAWNPESGLRRWKITH
jgi:hypothetical protein